jgi:hypothetical protein
MKPIDRFFRCCPQADVDAAVGRDRCHIGPEIDPEIGIFLAPADSVRPRIGALVAQRAEDAVVKHRGSGKVAHGD